MLSDVLSCTKCGLRSTCRSPVPMQRGSTFFSWMIVGEAPGENEDAQGIPFIGKSGELLDYAIKEAGFERELFSVTNVVKCRPPGNRQPTDEEKELCSGWLDRELEERSPSVIITLGKTAFMRFFQYSSVQFKNGVTFDTGNRHYLVLYHPSYWLRNGGKIYANREVVPILRSTLERWR